MIRLARRTFLLVTFYVLTSAVMADAACAWVLWKDVRFPQTSMEAVDAFDSRARCVAEINKAEAREKKDPAPYTVNRFNDTDLFVGSRPTDEKQVLIHMRCLPDTMDPRGPKGARP